MRYTSRQRRDAILEEVYGHSQVAASELAERLGVSEATVRRDLHALAEAGKVDLVYGGATAPRNSDFSFQAKSLRNTSSKKQIGAIAAGLLADGDQIFLDSGTTCFEMLPGLKRRKRLSIICNSARLALELDTPNLDVILLGGHYRPDRMDTVGPLASAALDQLRGYRCFIGADGLSMDFGLTAGDVESAHMYRQAVLNASEVILLADASKFQSASLCKIVDWQPVTRVVTDALPDETWAAFFAERNIEVLTPKTAAEDAESQTDGEV